MGCSLEREYLVAYGLRFCRLFAWTLLALLLLRGLAVASEESTQKLDSTWTLCREEAGHMERAADLPAQILSALALQESGRPSPNKSEILAWPWTVMAEGRGRYLPSKAAAIAEVEKLQARGVPSIDVGCMQVNLHHHPRAFTSLEEAFDPLSNMAYAAAFLTDLRAETRSWTRALGYYHSRNNKKSLNYRRNVLKLWRSERKRVRDQKREERRKQLAARD